MLPRILVTIWLRILVAGLTTASLSRADASTYAEGIGGLLWAHCGSCHHAGGVGPFSVLRYDDLLPRLKSMATAIRNGDMPPWPPEDGQGDFLGSRRLPADDRQQILDWLEHGAPPGNLERLGPPPEFPDGWQLGKPDLVLAFPQPFAFGGDGDDIYRNFVIPLPPGTNRYVRALEFLPGSPVIHHARFLLDASGAARRLDADDAECGFGGTMPPGRLPEGQFGGWVPGRQPTLLPPEQAWPLDNRGDLVVQLHLRRTGLREIVQPRIGFHLTHRGPGELPIRLGLISQWFELKPLTSNQVVSRSLEIPAEMRLLSVMPHAHQRATQVEFNVTPPGQPTRSLLRIQRWRFDWQDEYRYREPILLGAGTRLEFTFRFDNPTLKTIRHGPNSTDEMAELWLQLKPTSKDGAERITRAGREFQARETAEAFTTRLRESPNNAAYHLELGKALAQLGKEEESFDHFATACELSPNWVEPHYQIGLSYLRRSLWVPARGAFAEALNLDPGHEHSLVGLGLAADGAHRPVEALGYLREALRLNPSDELAKTKIEELESEISAPTVSP